MRHCINQVKDKMSAGCRLDFALSVEEPGMDPDDMGTLNFFVSVGLREADGAPRPAMAMWDGFREEK